jgi:hypothetical protein
MPEAILAINSVGWAIWGIFFYNISEKGKCSLNRFYLQHPMACSGKVPCKDILQKSISTGIMFLFRSRITLPIS